MTEKVVLLGPQADAEVQAVSGQLSAMNVGFTLWDSQRWPGDLGLTLDPSGGQLVVAGERVEAPRVVYIRNLAQDPVHERYRDRLGAQPFALINQLREYRGLVLSALRQLAQQGATLVNPLETLDTHQQKPAQLQRFAEANLPVPATLVTNDPQAARAFVEHHEDVVYKPVAGGGYARQLARESLTAYPWSRLANAPVQFQQRCRGENRRYYVLDGQVLAAARIVTDRLDYRSAPHRLERLDASGACADAAITATQSLGLVFAAVDVMADGPQFKLLEANPSPMFAEFDRLAGTRVGNHLAEWLAGHD